MLDSLRKISSTWFGRILGVFLIIGLAGFGISNVLLQLGTETVASVGGVDISTRDFQRAYQAQLSQLTQQIGRTPTAEEAVAFGIPGVVLARLSAETAISVYGEKLGLGVAEDRLAKMVRDEKGFQGTLGNFDPAIFKQVLRQQGYTEAEYLDMQARAARRQQLATGLFAGSPVPQTAYELMGRYMGDKRSVDYFVLSAEALPPVAAPTDAELEAYLKDHQAEYRTKEARTVDVLVLSAERLAATKTVADADIAAEYERTKDSLTKPEKRTIKQVTLATADQIKAFEDGKAAGKKIGQMLAETALPFQDLGTFAKADLTDASLADAAFGLAVDDFVVIEGVGGAKRAITVSAIEPGGTPTLAEVTPQIRDALALKTARTEYGDVQDQIEELRAAFKPLSDIATRFNLKPETLSVTDVSSLAPLGELSDEDKQKINTTIFAAKEGDLTPAVPLQGNSYLWFDLKKVEPARDQTLADVRDAVLKAWTAEKTEAAITAKIDELLEKLKAGTPFADVAQSVNQLPQLSQPFGRQGDESGVIDTPVANEVFAGGEGHFGTAKNGNGEHVLFQVADIVPGTVDAATAQQKASIENSLRDTLYADFVNGVRDETGIRVNQQALGKLLGLDQTGQ